MTLFRIYQALGAPDISKLNSKRDEPQIINVAITHPFNSQSGTYIMQFYLFCEAPIACLLSISDSAVSYLKLQE